MANQNLLLSILKAAASPFRQATGIGQEIVRKTAALTPEQYQALQQQGGKLGSVSQATSLTEKEAQDPLIVAKSLAGIGSYVIPAAKIAKGATAIQKLGQIGGRVIAPGAMSGFSSSEQGKELASAALGGLTSGLVYGGAKAVQSVARAGSNRFMDSVFRERIKDTKNVIRQGVGTLGQKASEKGFKGLTNQSILKGSVETMDALESRLQDGLTKSKETISIDDLKNATKPLIDKYTKSGNISAVNSIASRLDAIEQANGKQIPVTVANEIKRSLYEEARNAYGQISSENMEGIKAIARALKEGIAKRVPGVDEVNQELSYFGRIADSMVDKLSRGGRNNLMGLGQSMLAGGGIAGAASTGGASLIPAALVPILGSTPGKILASRGLSKVAGGTGKITDNEILQKALIQLSGKAGAGVAGLLGSQGQPQAENGEQNNVEQLTPPQDIVAQLPPDRQKAMDIIDQAEAQFKGTGQTITGFSTDQLGKAYSMALQAGDTKAATKLKQMYDLETEFSKSKEGKKLTATEKSTEAAQVTASDALKFLQNNKDLKVGLLETPIQQTAAKFGKADQKTLEFNTMIGGLKAMIAKARAGTSFTPNEEKLLNTYVPVAGDSRQVLETKLKLLQTPQGKSALETLMTPSATEQSLQLLQSQGLNL